MEHSGPAIHIISAHIKTATQEKEQVLVSMSSILQTALDHNIVSYTRQTIHVVTIG